MCENFTNQLNEVPLKHFSFFFFFRLTHYSRDETNLLECWSNKQEIILI